MRNQFEIVKNVVNQLKQSFGCLAAYYQPLNTTEDLTSGEQTRSYKVTHLEAILLPFKLHSIFSYDAAYGAGGNNRFSMGGKHDKTERTFIAALTDEPKLTDFIIIYARKYGIKEVQVYPEYKIAVLTLNQSASDKERFLSLRTEIDLRGVSV